MIWSPKLADLSHAGANSKPHHYKHKKKQLMKDLSKTRVWTGKQFENFRQKKTEKTFSTFRNNSVEHTSPKYNNWIWPLKTVRIKINKTWIKEFRWKLWEICKTRTKKLSPDMLNFYAELAGHDIVTDAGRANLRKLKFNGPSIQI